MGAGQTDLTETPLGTYLRKRGISRQAFAERMSKLRGCKLDVNQVGRWVTGRYIPVQATRVLIAKATRYEVKVGDWDGWVSSRYPHEQRKKNKAA